MNEVNPLAPNLYPHLAHREYEDRYLVQFDGGIREIAWRSPDDKVHSIAVKNGAAKEIIALLDESGYRHNTRR